MKTYKLRPGSFETKRPQANRQAAISIMISLSAVMGVFILNRPEMKSWIAVLVFGVVMLLVAIKSVLGTRRALAKSRVGWDSYSLTIYEDRVLREIAGFPDIEIRKSDIKALHLYKGKGFTVKATNQRDPIFVPETLEGYEDVLAELSAFCATSKPSFLSRIPANVFVIVGVLGFVGFGVSKQIQIVIPLGLLLAACLVWSLVAVQRSKLIDAKTRRKFWILAFPIFGVVGKMVVMILEKDVKP